MTISPEPEPNAYSSRLVCTVVELGVRFRADWVMCEVVPLVCFFD